MILYFIMLYYDIVDCIIICHPKQGAPMNLIMTECSHGAL